MNINNGILANYTGIPIIVISDSKKQNRTHRKKRINKKWAKRYGYMQHNPMEDNQVISLNGNMYMNPRTYYKMKSLLPT